MSESDAEWYLCRRAEDELLAGHGSTLDARGRALLAVGMLSPDIAKRVIDRYARARAIRGLDDGERRGTVNLPASSLASPRISPSGRVIDQPWGTVTVNYVASTGQSTNISVTVLSKRPRQSHPGTPHQHNGPPTITVTDDRGRKHTTSMSGGGTDHEWTGHYTINPALRPDTEWITILGERIALADGPSDVSVTVETFDPHGSAAAMAERHLTRCLEASARWHRQVDTVSIAAETFVACGVLPADAEVITQAYAIEELLIGGSVPGSAVPARWRSIIARRNRNDGAVGTRIIGATTPIFGDIRVTLLDLRSTESDCQLEFEAAGLLGSPRRQSVAEQMFTVSALDDRGNHYLGAFQEFGSGSDGMHGTIGFGAPLDPTATTLDVQIANDRARAVMHIPLHWQGRTHE